MSFEIDIDENINSPEQALDDLVEELEAENLQSNKVGVDDERPKLEGDYWTYKGQKYNLLQSISYQF